MTRQTQWTAAPGPRRLQDRSGPCWIPAPLACALCLIASIAQAQDAHLAADDSEVTTYLEAIQRAQTAGGPYASELVDLYYGYGQSLLEEGDLEGARDAFHRTAMVSRVNSGPNSLEQTNYLYSIAQIESMLGNLEESVGVLEHIYLLHAMRYGEEEVAMLPVVEQIYGWYAEQQPLKAPLARASDYQNRSYLAGRIARLTEASNGLGHADTAGRYREAGQIHFRAIYYMLQSGEPPQPELVMNDDDKGAQWYYERSISNHFREGEEAFARVVEAWRENPQATALDVAEAMAQLGDWYLALQHFRSAERQYEQAFQLLSDSAEFSGIVDDYLGVPAPLRFLNTTDQFVRDLDAPVAIEDLEVAMTVTRSGRLVDVEVVRAPPGHSEQELGELVERLEKTRFRPAVVDGKVEGTTQFVWKPPLVLPKVAVRNG